MKTIKTEDQDITANTATHRQNKPLMLGFSARTIGDDRESSGSKIAAAWAQKDGQGFEVRMGAMPVDGSPALRTVTEKDPESGEVLERTPDDRNGQGKRCACPGKEA